MIARSVTLKHRIGAELWLEEAAELVPELVDLITAYHTQERLHHSRRRRGG